MWGSVSEALSTNNQGEMESERRRRGAVEASKKYISLVGSMKEVASGEVAEEQVIGGLATAPNSTIIVVGAIRSCTNKTKRFFGIGREGIVSNFSYFLEFCSFSIH